MKDRNWWRDVRAMKGGGIHSDNLDGDWRSAVMVVIRYDFGGFVVGRRG